MGDGFDHKKGVATPGRNVATQQPVGVPGKRTLVELCYENGPSLEEMMRQFRDRAPSVLDPPPLEPEEIKRRIAEGLSRAKQQVIGALPLGGWLAAPRDVFEEHVRKDEGEIISRTLQAAESTASGAFAVGVASARHEPPLLIMRRGEAAAVVEQIVTALSVGIGNSTLPHDPRGSARSAPPELQADADTALASEAKAAAVVGVLPAKEPVTPAPFKETDPIGLDHDLFAKVANPVIVEIRYTNAMKKSPEDACFFKAAIEWVQGDIQLRTSKRSPNDAKARRRARVLIKNQGIDISHRDASHPLDSIINVLFDPGTGAYYFAHESVNRSFGAQLRELGKLPEGTPIVVEFVDFPDIPPGHVPPTTSNRIKE